jgi:hypothetical protein
VILGAPPPGKSLPAAPWPCTSMRPGNVMLSGSNSSFSGPGRCVNQDRVVAVPAKRNERDAVAVI